MHTIERMHGMRMFLAQIKTANAAEKKAQKAATKDR